MNKTSDLLMPVKSKACNITLDKATHNTVWKKKFYTALYWPEVSHHIRFHTMVKLSWQRVWWNHLLPEFGLWEMQKGIFFSLLIILWPTKKFDRSKVWLCEFRLSEEILLGINILILIRGWTGLWSETRIDVCSVIYGCCCQPKGQKTPVRTNGSMDHVI